jgi:hypothetical protein
LRPAPGRLPPRILIVFQFTLFCRICHNTISSQSLE